MVEIGIPAYNSALHIGEAVAGCLNQDYPDIKVIVVDDRSTDDTATVVKNFEKDKRIRLSVNEQNLGRVKNYRHILYDLTDAEWYINLDADDYFTDPEFISNAMALLEKSNGPINFYQGNHNLDKLKRVLPKFRELSPHEILVDGKEYFIHFPRIRKNTHCATIYNRRRAIELDFYSFDCLYTDFHSLSRLALTGDVILSSKKVAEWRQHSGNASKTMTEAKLQNELASLEEVASFAQHYIPAEAAATWLKQMKNYYTINFIYQQSTYSPGLASISFIIQHWQFDWMYPRYLLKNLLLMTTRAFKRKGAK